MFSFSFRVQSSLVLVFLKASKLIRIKKKQFYSYILHNSNLVIFWHLVGHFMPGKYMLEILLLVFSLLKHIFFYFINNCIWCVQLLTLVTDILRPLFCLFCFFNKNLNSIKIKTGSQFNASNLLKAFYFPGCYNVQRL